MIIRVVNDAAPEVSQAAIKLQQAIEATGLHRPYAELIESVASRFIRKD